MKRLGWATAFVVSAAIGLLGSVSGCTTSSYCFTDCEGSGGSAASTGGGGTDGGGTGGINFDGSSASGGGINFDSGQDSCVSNPPEICNGVDDDCNGKIDDGIDFTKPENCGTCATNCTQFPHAVNATCTPPTKLDGTEPGTCKYDCEQDWYDIVKDETKAESKGCEYNCTWNPDGTNTTDPGGAFGCERDDDCDGKVDEDLNTCDDIENCGKCGKLCTIPHASVKCVSTAPAGTQCTTANTDCEIDKCDAGYFDVNKSSDDGCEYKCPVTTPTAEICDGIDNDCDGLIDDADDSLETGQPELGQACFGGTSGVCAVTAHEGVKKCIGAIVTCCDKTSNTIAGTNPNFPTTGVRNGVCDDPAYSANGCQSGEVCTPGDQLETCNGEDDDCDGTKDNNLTDEGGKCGSNVGNCSQGTEQCANKGTATAKLTCVGAVGTSPELCNGQDDDCDGVIDGTLPASPVSCTTSATCASTQFCATVVGGNKCANQPTDSIGDCAPPGLALPVPLPCLKGSLACTGGVVQCVGAKGPTSPTDKCGEDSNCNGLLESQPNLQTDVKNCGSCGNDCNQKAPNGHGVWSCQTGTCVRTGCQGGFFNCGSGPFSDNNNDTCEYACTVISSAEQCNGVDDNCNCAIDDAITAVPTPSQVCGVAAGATDPGCQGGAGGITVACQSGGWKCTFPAGYCTGGDCSTAPDLCDNKDNNCNGQADESFKFPALTSGYLGQPCASDDGKPPPGDGACRTTGTFVCNGTTATKCNATTNLANAGPELCNGQDDDCDGTIDEPFKATTVYPAGKGTNATYFVKPAATKIAASVWMTQYEVSRPGATASNPGSGNGWQTSAPTGATLDKTQACSVQGVVPWFNVNPPEASQVCAQRGGRLCSLSDWQTACTAGIPCKWGYDPRGASCTSAATGSKFCNIGPTYDFDGAAAGDQDGLLPTGWAGPSPISLQHCWADWNGLQGNNTTTGKLFDITGNLREITYNSVASPGGCNQSDPASTCLYTLMGGAFNTASEDGAQCNFSFYTVNAAYKLFDVGYRCCFDQDPTL